MIEIIFSYVNRIKSRLTKIVDAGTVDMYGSGELGNVYYGATDNVPSILEWDRKFTEFTSYTLPLTRAAHFKNLYIDSGVTLKSLSEWSTIMVSDTLYLRGKLSCSNTHLGASNYFATYQAPTFATKLQMFGETNYLPTLPFCITGGKNNPCFGNSATGGGFVAVYYTTFHQLNTNDELGNTTLSLASFTNVNGGTSGSNAGGCLIIAAKRIAIASTGKIENYGGDGQNTATAGMFVPYKITARTTLIE